MRKTAVQNEVNTSTFKCTTMQFTRRGLKSFFPSNKVLKGAATEWAGAKIISDRWTIYSSTAAVILNYFPRPPEPEGRRGFCPHSPHFGQITNKTYFIKRPSVTDFQASCCTFVYLIIIIITIELFEHDTILDYFWDLAQSY